MYRIVTTVASVLTLVSVQVHDSSPTSRTAPEALISEIGALLEATGPPDRIVEYGPWSPFGDKAMELCSSLRSEQTGSVTQLLHNAEKTHPEARNMLLIALSLHGDQRQTIGLYLDIVRMLKPDAHAGVYEWVASAYTARAIDGVAVRLVMGSAEPVSVAYRIALLRDSRAPPVFRNMAYVSLARTGGPAGLVAVQAARGTAPDPTRAEVGTHIAAHADDDTKKVLNAAADGLLRFISGRNTLFVILPDRVPPFQFRRMGRAVVICGGTFRDAGVGDRKRWPRIAFRYPSYDLDGRAVKIRPTGASVLFNESHTRAKVQIVGGLDLAGYDVTLAKFGADWIATDAAMAWVS